MKTLAFAALAALSIAAVPAAAQEAQVSVRYGDLDVASAAGLQTLGARVEAGADTLCGRPSFRDLKSAVAVKDCKNAVINTAVEQLNAKGVSVEASQLVG